MSIAHTCASCGHQMAVPERYAGKELFCTACKRPFTAPSSAPATAPPGPATPTPPPPTPAACPACATPLPQGATFCPKCGAAVGTIDAAGLLRRPGGITALAVLNGLAACMTGLMALAVLLSGTEDEPAVAALMGTILGVIAILQVAAAVGLWQLRQWGRLIQIGLCCLGLLALPLGTLVSALVLWYMLRGSTRVLFSGKSVSELGPAEISLLSQRSENVGVVVAVVVAVLLVVIMFVGIIAAIAVPNLLNAINRGRQKRSIADMRSLAVAIESYAVDYNRYPAPAESVDELAPDLVPTYIGALPSVDGWEHPFEVAVEERTYSIASLGRDGRAGPRPGGPTTDFDDDIVYQDGTFMQWPEGIDVR